MHLLISVDGVVQSAEEKAFDTICKKERIPDDIYQEFKHIILTASESEIYQRGIRHLEHCSGDDKLRVFATLYRMSEIDGLVHIKELRLVLYAIQLAKVEFDDVVSTARVMDPIL